MKKKLAEILKCLTCGKTEFSVIPEKEDAVEVRQGVLECGGCGTRYQINQGIVDFLLNPSKTVLDEIEGENRQLEQEGTPECFSEDALLKMPYYRMSGGDPFGHFHSAEVNFTEMVKRMNPQAGMSMLDVGVAQGWTSHRFAGMGLQVTATEINLKKPLGLEMADIFFKDGLYFNRVRCDMHTLPFRSGIFDYVFFNNVVHHADSLKGVFSICFAMLKPGGRLVLIGEPSGGLFSSRDAFGKNLREDYNINENLYMFTEYRRSLRQSGFRNTRFFFPPAIDLRLTTGKYGWPRVNKSLFKFIHSIWKISWLRPFLKVLLYWPAALLFNFQVHCIARKPLSGARGGPAAL